LNDFTNLIIDGEVGEIFEWDIAGFLYMPYQYYRVDSISAISLSSSDSLKVQHVSFSNDSIEFFDLGEMVIEKIGFASSMFPNFPIPSCDLSFVGPVRCYEDSEIGLVNIGDLPCEYVPIKNIESDLYSLKIFPNPSIEKIYVDHISNSFDELFFEIITIEGETISSSNLLTNEIDISNLESGIYFLKIFKKNGFVQILKFVKE